MLHLLKNKVETSKFSKIAKNTYKHWIVQRFTAILLIPSFIFLFFGIGFSISNGYLDTYNSVEIFTYISQSYPFWVSISLFIFFVILFVHLIEGIENVILDYVHNEKSVFLCSIFLKCVQIELLKYVYIFLFFQDLYI